MKIRMIDGNIEIVDSENAIIDVITQDEIICGLVEFINHCDHIGMIGNGDRLFTLMQAYKEMNGIEE